MNENLISVLITICARGGSKGVPGKNIRPLCGKPLIAHTIEQACSWGKAGRVVVSTDSDEIAEVACAYGAEVPFIRPQELARDDSPKLPVVRHALMSCEDLYGETYDVIVDLDATSPMRTVDDLDACYRAFVEHEPRTLFSVVRAHKNPYFNMVEASGEGFVSLCKELPKDVSRRQDAPVVYDMNASIYMYDRGYLLDERNVGPISDRSIVHVMDERASYDVDREIDFQFLEFLMTKEVGS